MLKEILKRPIGRILRKTLNSRCFISKNPKAPSSKSCVLPELGFSDVRRVHPALRTYLGYCFHKVTSILKSEMSEALQKYKMQGHHMAILSVIASTKTEINQMKLCEETGIDKASMVKIVDHLEKLKLIERIESKDDRRVKNLIVTKNGLTFSEKFDTLRSQVEAHFLNVLTDQEIKTLKNTLLKILDQHQSR